MQDKALRFTGADGAEMELDTETGTMRRVVKKMLVDKLIEFDDIQFTWDTERQHVKASYQNARIDEQGTPFEIMGVANTANEAIREMLHDMKGEVIIKDNKQYTVDNDGNFMEVQMVQVG